MSGCLFSVLLQKVKIKIQNDVIGHQSASLSVNEDVRTNFNQSYQCLNALKCQKCAIKKIDRKILMLTPGPLSKSHHHEQKVNKVLAPGSFFDRSFSSQVFESSRHNHEQKVVLISSSSQKVVEIIKCSLQGRSYKSRPSIVLRRLQNRLQNCLQIRLLMKMSGSILNSVSML